MYITCLDLEGVLVPEVWINVAEKTGIEELKLTTRDIRDYDELMQHRLKVIAEHGLTLSYIQEVIGTLKPFDGALEFLEWLRRQCQVVILSDTFVEFAAPLMEQLGMPTILCHSLIVENDVIQDYKLRIDNPKGRAIKAFQSLNYRCIAAGDSYNDLSMIEQAEHGFFFRPPATIIEEFPDRSVATEYSEFKALISKALND